MLRGKNTVPNVRDAPLSLEAIAMLQISIDCLPDSWKEKSHMYFLPYPYDPP